MSDSGKAVFLSYASQDVEAAKRICDALRAAGVEVWFDAEGGLEHGDEWDAKIRRQIKECVLFLPIISANTQAREEGYFRIEWELAAQRALGIASGVAFILPIVIDDTREPDALVPDRFRTVQWTRLRGGELPPDVKARFLKLWSHRAGLVKHEAGTKGPGTRDQGPGARPETRDPRTQNLAKPGWKAYAGLAVAIFSLVAVVGWWMLRREAPVVPPPAVTTSAVPNVPALSEARQLVAKAQPLHENMGGATRADFDLAGELFKRALELAPLDAEVWAHYSWFCNNIYGIGVDRSSQREAEIKRSADRAFKLDPASPMARLAWANYYRRQPAATEEAIRVLRELVRQHPGNKVMLRVLANALRSTPGKSEEALAFLDQAIALPGGDAHAWTVKGDILSGLGRAAEAEAAYDQSLAAKRTPRVLIRQALFLMRRHGDLTGAETLLAQVPGEFMQEDRAVAVASLLALWQRKPALCLKVLAAFSRDYIEDGSYTYLSGSKAGRAGLARWQEGKPDLARVEWREGLRVVEQRLANRRTDEALLWEKVFLLAALERRPEAETAAKLLGQLDSSHAGWDQALIDAWTGEKARALQFLAGQPVTPQLRYGPHWEPLRDDPRFQKLLADGEAAQLASQPPRDWPKNPELKKALSLLDRFDAIPEDIRLAEEIAQRVLDLAPTDPEAVAAMGRVQATWLMRGWDRSSDRYLRAQRMAERAVQLAPEEPEALAALAAYLHQRGTDGSRARQLIGRAIELDPDNARLHRLRTDVLMGDSAVPRQEAFAAIDRTLAQFPGDALVHYDAARHYRSSGRSQEFEREIDAALAIAPVANAMVWKARAEFGLRHNLPGMKAALDAVPARVRGIERTVFGYFIYAVMSGHHAVGVNALNDMAEPWMIDFDYRGPKALPLAALLELQGKPSLARVQYEVALREVKQRQASEPDDIFLRGVEAWILHGLGRADEARAALRIFNESVSRPYRLSPLISWWFHPIACNLLLDERATALAFIREAAETEGGRDTVRRFLATDPRMAPLRDDSEIKALLAEPEAKP